MFAKLLLPSLLLAGCAPVAADVSAPRPTTAATTAQRVAQCKGLGEIESWSAPAPPLTIFANVHYVGSCGITALLVTSPQGHVLIDAATAEAAPHIAANIEQLGYKLGDVKLILTSHEHLDHVGGVAELQRRTGAQLLARAPAKGALESGETDPADPQAGLHPKFPGARVGRIVRDGEVVRLGDLAFTALDSTGHASGSTSWSWTSCAGTDCRAIVYADSLNAISADGYRFTDHPALLAAFDKTFDKIAGLKCDLLLTPHPGASRMFDRLDGKAPLFDTAACAAYAAAGRQRLDARLAKEAAPAP